MDRRRKPRTNWNSSIKYRMLYSNVYQKGILVNMGENGALLSLVGDYGVGDSFEVLMPSHGRPDHVFMRVVRAEKTNREGYTGYGCKVGMTLSEAA